MKVKIWGCRGSLPTPGRDTLRYGGDTTCLEIISNVGQRIIIDCGSGIRRLGNSLIKNKELNNLTILLTHAHWDHLVGFPFFFPAYMPNCKINICGGPLSQEVTMKYLEHQMEAPYFPVDISEMKAEFTKGCQCDWGNCDNRPSGTDGSIKCASIPLNHPNGGYGYKFVSENRTFVFLSDNEIRFAHKGGRSRDEYVEFCRGTDLIFLDAQYTEKQYVSRKSWGHSTYIDAVNLAIDAGVKRLGLFHHDPESTDDYLDKQFEYCHDYIKKNGGSLECFVCADGMEFDV
jgi:phosphoribosyl 1,2-cyclic phosphodiesterase